jgi:hypothetical protein
VEGPISYGLGVADRRHSSLNLGGGDSAPPAARLLHLRGRAVHARRLAGAGGRRGAETPVTSASSETRCICR